MRGTLLPVLALLASINVHAQGPNGIAALWKRGSAAYAQRDYGSARDQALGVLGSRDASRPSGGPVALGRAAPDSSSSTLVVRRQDPQAAAAAHDAIVAANAPRIAAEADSANKAAQREDSIRQVTQAAEQLAAARARAAARADDSGGDFRGLFAALSAFGISQQIALTVAVALAALLALIIGIPALRYVLARPSQVVEFPMQPGEKQVWIGAPMQGLILSAPRPARWAGQLIPLAIFVGFFWLVGLWPNLVFFLPFFAIAFAASVGGKFNDARRRKLTTYALTTKRAIVCVGNDVQSSPIDQLTGAELVENKDGTYRIEWGSAQRDLQAELQRAIDEGRSPSTIPVGSVVRGALVRKRSFDKLEDALSVHTRIQELTGTHPEPRDARAADGSAVSVSVTSSASARVSARDVLQRTRKSVKEAVSSSMTKGDWGFAVLFFGAFALIGSTIGYFVGWPALRETLDAQGWAGVPCEIVSSGVHRSHDSDGSSYSVEVKFRYDYAGLHYYGDRYQITSMSQGGMGAYERIERKLAAIPAGQSTTCWVNPARPDRAVIDRGLSGGTMLAVGLPALFSVIGVAGLIAALRERAMAVS